MQIDHVALWTHQLEALKGFYCQFFEAQAGEKYHNPRTGFESYFLSFAGGARLEIMQMPPIPANQNDLEQQAVGWIHIAIATGSREKVDNLTEQIRAAGHRVMSEPRTTGDGYYESVILDPDGNRIEITI